MKPRAFTAFLGVEYDLTRISKQHGSIRAACIVAFVCVDTIQGYTLVKLGEETHASHHGRRPHKSCNTTPFLSRVLVFPALSDQGATKDELLVLFCIVARDSDRTQIEAT